MYPSYATTRALDELRAAEYPALNAHTYLDYTAANVYALSQLDRHHALLRESLFGNPHSTNPASSQSAEFVERARRAVLAFFSASPDEWEVVFTANASQALKLIGESYPFARGDQFLLTFDNHNSVNGIREFARAAGATATYVPVVLPEMRVDEHDLAAGLELARPGGHNLFAYPAQSNFSGVQHPLEWIDARAREGLGRPARRRGVHGDQPARPRAAGRPTSSCSRSTNCSATRPASAACSPARRRSPSCSVRGFPAGRSPSRRFRATSTTWPKARRRSRTARSTTWRCRPSRSACSTSSRSASTRIHERVRCLTGWLLENLLALRQTNGAPLVRLYGPPTTDRRGGIVTFNFYGADGRAIDHRLVERRANAADISLRTGCFCNPGGGEIALGLTGTELSTCFRKPEHETHFTVDDFRLCIDGKSTGAVRVSLGMVSNVQDVDRFIAFAKEFIGP